jgi:L-aspartate oxidase
MWPSVVVIGGGLAGLSAALALAPVPVLLVSLAPIGSEAASGWAQGGIAAAVGADDSPALHAADTLAAGDGLCDPTAVERIIGAGPPLIGSLAAAGVRFDRDAGGALALGLEAAHGRRRIVHAGDSTGREVMRALAARVRAAASVTVLEGRGVARLIVRDGAVAGVVLESGQAIGATRVVIATGGVGGLYCHTTNPRGAWGQGLLLAGRAGAALADLEFVQFHPTALDVGRDPMPLVSEAVRGEGGILVDEAGHRFMAAPGVGYRRAELEPRDVVSRAVWAHLADRHSVFLDATDALGSGFVRHFPTIAGFCRQAGIDPATQPIPVRPAAHYHMGGIATDAEGRTSVGGLFACGECASTGLHGANRLASNSLLEAAVCGAAVAGAIKDGMIPAAAAVADRAGGAKRGDPQAVRPIMSAGLGVLRDQDGMRRAVADLLRLADAGGPAADPASVGLAIAVSASRREESRGAHWRTDRPGRASAARRSLMTLEQAFAMARDAVCVAA